MTPEQTLNFTYDLTRTPPNQTDAQLSGKVQAGLMLPTFHSRASVSSPAPSYEKALLHRANAGYSP